jgi:hypothetical protein
MFFSASLAQAIPLDLYVTYTPPNASSYTQATNLQINWAGSLSPDGTYYEDVAQMKLGNNPPMYPESIVLGQDSAAEIPIDPTTGKPVSFNVLPSTVNGVWTFGLNYELFAVAGSPSYPGGASTPDLLQTTTFSMAKLLEGTPLSGTLYNGADVIGTWTLLDPDVAPAPVPEPASLLLMGMGLPGIGFVTWRLRRQS